MASVIKRRVLEVLAEYLRPLVAPEIPSAHVIVEDAGTEREACWPNLVVRQLGSFEFEPFEDDELWVTADTQAVQVGDMRGQIEVVLGATAQAQREELEERILNAFLSSHDSAGHPRRGVVVQQLDSFKVGQYAGLAAVPVGYVLGTEAWQEEMVFDRKRFASLVLDVDVPAIVVRDGVYDIQTLVVAITDDLTSDTPTPDYQVAVEEDGDLTPYP